MFCHKRGSTLAIDALFCSRCGVRVPTGEAPPPAESAAPATSAPVPAPNAAPARSAPGVAAAEAQIAARAGTVAVDPRQEVDIWTGRYSAKALAQYYVALAAWAIVIVVVAVRWSAPWALWAVLILAPAAVLFGRLLYLKWTIKYRLTTQRFFHTYGFAVQRTDETELLKVDDVTMEQTLLERLFDVGTLVLETSDRSEPRKLIRGIAHPVELKEFVRSYALQARQGQQVMRVHSV